MISAIVYDKVFLTTAYLTRFIIYILVHFIESYTYNVTSRITYKKLVVNSLDNDLLGRVL